ncbi:MAG: undecaprenyldiphospho-muramoylpentapeptide beta-N-acetylglucosaminyltransferase [Ruminococcaceae bacterium]|nr:undecaprenyldiphospho-muramoylpentapeptide beta-N-acetylglucosaminyltransferase [Oscillospiraceae bacterium]
MKVMLAGGGTAGHINPALAIAGEIKKNLPDAEITFVGTPHGMESELVPKAGYAYETMNVAGFQRKLSLTNIKRNAQAAWYLLTSGARARSIVNKIKPDIAIGTGGYVSGPIMRMAAKMGVPVIIHEQNAFPGVTTKMLSKKAACVMLAVEDARPLINTDAPMVVTGNPIRSDILSYDRSKAREELGLDERPLVLSFGGSLGARRINEGMLDLLCRSATDGRYQHIHGYGRYGHFILDEMKKRGVDPENTPNLDVREYIDDMPRVMAAADLIICRAGAITLSELQARGKAAILIPSPNVAENHQYHNAMALVNRGAADIIVESELNGGLVVQKADAILCEPEKLRRMAESSHNMAITDACERIFEVMEKVLAEAGKPIR